MFPFDLTDANADTPAGNQVGGGACWPADMPWPTTADGAPMRPLLTLRQSLFLIPTLPTGHVVTVFAPHHEHRHRADLRACAQTQATRLPPVPRGVLHEGGDADNGLRVILHPEAPAWSAAGTWPALQLMRRAASHAEQGEEVADDIHGLAISKLFGRPHWLQDELCAHNSQHFVLQLVEHDLAQANAAYNGLWDDGVLYLFLNHGLTNPLGDLRGPTGLCGRACVQFT